MKINFTIRWKGNDYTNKQDLLVKEIFFKECKQHYCQVYRSKIHAFNKNLLHIKKHYGTLVRPGWASETPIWNFAHNPKTFITNALNDERLMVVHRYRTHERNVECVQECVIQIIIDMLMQLGCRYITKTGFEESTGKMRSWVKRIIKKNIEININEINFD